ncbi:hypothetical protein [Lysobacter sp. CFH 32150]|uniref:hypothetical protein n=1 Tax=Lysobacter sp. CFH 32150 TaxID=2927128 RepID=UPI001FA6F833|nr:hypothetical protein [Lysobacter sp. CFH 32150]MCI4566382.1 hypothetical protein [Lysobacter sp. CFH 32150]
MKQQERRYFDLPDGRKLPLPLLPNLDEFLLAGNFREFTEGRFWAFFDDDTRTGATYQWDHQLWHLHQPHTRESFWAYCEDLLRWDEENERNRQVVTALGTALGVPTNDGGAND